MTRPCVQIDTENQIGALRKHLESMLPHFTTFHGLVGLTLNGGLSRGYADHLSEIDLTFFLTPQGYESWQEGQTPIALGITVLDGQLYDIKHLNYVTEKDRDWDEVTLWDASYAEILYDPENLLHELLAEKVGEGPDPAVAEGLLMNCWWHFELAGQIWIERGDALQGHQMFNQAVVALVQALFVANREYIPHEKWLLHLSRSLEWRPPQWDRRLGAAMSTGDLTIDSLRARQGAIRALWEEVNEQIRARFYPQLPVYVMQKSTYEELKILAERESVSLEEWRARSGAEMPNSDPFHPLITQKQGRISLDRAMLARIGPHEMYAWHYEVLQAVAKEQKA